ncbi:hypothetical protein M3Y99_00858000 [Aphelenchoides fujianensis]|nr:hypothetical protein M3Y99_00858000 [Aphelenchoides fujianensis]
MTIGAFNWWKWALQLVLATLLSDLALAQAPTCTCPGQQVNVSGHASCFQVVRDSGGSWTAADKKCSNLGGFIAHVDSPALLGNLTSYIQQNYQQQLMTGGLVGNAEYQLIAMICNNHQWRSFFHRKPNDQFAVFRTHRPLPAAACFCRNTDFKLHYGNCNETSDVLCEIPMDSDETCGVMMQCAASSTSSPWSSQRPNASNPPPAAAGNVNPPPQNQNAANPPNSITSPPPPPRSSSRSPFAINSASSQSAKSSSVSPDWWQQSSASAFELVRPAHDGGDEPAAGGQSSAEQLHGLQSADQLELERTAGANE